MCLVEDLQTMLMESVVADPPDDDALIGVQAGVALALDHALGAHFLQFAAADGAFVLVVSETPVRDCVPFLDTEIVFVFYFHYYYIFILVFYTFIICLTF